MSDVVALLLDDALPPERLGSLLQAARKRRGWKRREAATHVRITPAQLRDYERGTTPVPAEICARLAECYGDDLTAHIPLRLPVQVDDGWIVAATDAESSGSGRAEDVLRGYVQLLTRLRGAKPGEPVALRATDLAAIAEAVNGDPEAVEARIVELLGCTRAEAARLRSQLLQRKVILPVAGLASGLALLVAAQSGPQTPSAPGPLTPATATTAETSLIADVVPDLAAPASPVDIAPVDIAPTPAPAPPTTAAAEAPPEVQAPAPAPAPEPALPAPLTDATVPPELVAPDAQAPVPEEGTVSILPGEEISGIIIGDAASEPTDP